MSDYASMNVIEKFCTNVYPGMTGNSIAINLTSALVSAIEKDVITSDFTPDEILDLNPRITCSPGAVAPPPQGGRGFSPIPPFRNSIWQSVTEFELFKRFDNDEDHWRTSMDTDRNLSGELFSARMINLAVDLYAMLAPLPVGTRALEEKWSSLTAINAIESTWKRVKKSLPRYYLCIDGDNSDCICEVCPPGRGAGNKKIISTMSADLP